MIRKNNLGQAGKITWGHLGKRRVLTNEVFKTIEVEREKERFDWKAKLKPFSINEKDTVAVLWNEKGVTPPTPPTDAIWNTFTQTWDTTTDSWENV